MQDTIDRLIDDFHERSMPSPLSREAELPRLPGKANVVIGMRRSGKTWFCFQEMRRLLADGVERERILYVNFEDERLLPFATGDFQTLLDTYFRKFPSFREGGAHLFLDEAQRIDGWELFVRRVLDSEKLDVVVTGSSSRLLGSEIATALRGRSLTTEIFPFDFTEFLRWNDVDPEPRTLGTRTRSRLERMAGVYLEQGGFPEVQGLDAHLRRQVLRNYVDVVILRDVIERHGIGNVAALRAMIRHIMSAPANRFSVNRFYNTLRSQGVAATKNALYDFLEHLVDAYLFFDVPLHSRSENVRRVNPRKLYVIDPGLLEAMSPPTAADRGARLENLVFLHLRRSGHRPEYYLTKSGREVDFVVTPEGRGARRLIQVCWDLADPDTRAREVTALREAMRELRIRSGTIVTWLDEDSSEEGIRIVPVWRWLLSG
ncbi:MAG: ATP-binding protein [Planctomycetota bacterium]